MEHSHDHDHGPGPGHGHGPEGVEPPAEVALGGWLLESVHFPGFRLLPDRGLRHSAEGAFPSSLTAASEPLYPPESTFDQYVDAQSHILRHYFPGCAIEPWPEFAPPPWAAQGRGVRVRFVDPASGHVVLIHQLYVEHGGTIGVLSFTTIEPDWPRWAPAMREVARTGRLAPPPAAAPPAAAPSAGA